MKKLILILVVNLFISITLAQINSPGVKIGNQTWMVKNLDVDHYRNGDLIPEVKDSVVWANLTTGAWCYYNNDPVNGKIYGKLYNWYAVNDPRGLAAAGWHIPSDTEWTMLATYLGGDSVAGGKMKETGTKNWNTPNFGATNSSGFTGRPTGYRDQFGSFMGLGLSLWWSSTESKIPTGALVRCLVYYHESIEKHNYYKKFGCSVRCVKN